MKSFLADRKVYICGHTIEQDKFVRIYDSMKEFQNSRYNIYECNYFVSPKNKLIQNQASSIEIRTGNVIELGEGNKIRGNTSKRNIRRNKIMNEVLIKECVKIIADDGDYILQPGDVVEIIEDKNSVARRKKEEFIARRDLYLAEDKKVEAGSKFRVINRKKETKLSSRKEDPKPKKHKSLLRQGWC